MDSRRGLSLIEIIIAITIITIVSVGMYVVSNPGGQLAAARNERRSADLQTLLIAIRENVADQANGQFGCAAGPLPSGPTDMGSASGSYDIAPCLIPSYLPVLPVDPNATSAHYVSVSDYDTGYAIMMNASGTITLSAPYAELGKTVTISR